MLAVGFTSVSHGSRLRPESPCSTHLLSPRSRKRVSRFMPTSTQILEYGLEPGDRARARDTDCSICQERVSNPVVTPCQHIYCFECIYEWLGRSTQCPDCRHDLKGAHQTASSKTYEAANITIKSTAGRLSSSSWATSPGYPQMRKPRRHVGPTSPDPHELASQLAALEQETRETSKRASGDTESTTTLPASREPIRHWCLQRHMPLRNRAAHPIMYYGSSNYLQYAYRDTAKPRQQLDTGICTSQGEHSRSSRLLTVNAEDMLSNMWQTSNTLADNTSIPIRCRAIAKCVWREWREFLQCNQGRDFYAGNLLGALTSTFEQAVVDYGWESDWRSLPEVFIQVMRSTARAAIEGRPPGMVRTNPL